MSRMDLSIGLQGRAIKQLSIIFFGAKWSHWFTSINPQILIKNIEELLF